MGSNRIIVGVVLSGLVNIGFCQDSLQVDNMSLNEVVNMAISKSSATKYARNQNVNYYWRYKNFKTSQRPQLKLESELPNYSRNTEAITQPDGGIKFIPTEIGKMASTLSLNQSISATGTQIYASSSVFRVNNYKDGEIQYSGSPVIIGFRQPILNFNWMKWALVTEPLVYEEAQKDYVQTIEEISLNAARRYFQYLRVQTDFQLAKNNLKNSEDNLKIAETNKALGRISENDYARIQLSVYNASKALNTAVMELKNADFELKTYIGMDPLQNIELELPLNMRLFQVDVDVALEEAKTNRKETPYYERRLIEAERELIKAKRSTSIKAVLNGNYGLSNNADKLAMVYDNPETALQVSVSLSVPILDWGRSASTVKLAKSKYDLVIYEVEKGLEDFERRVVVLVEKFSLLKEQINTSRQADVVANNGYQIAQRKFQNGEISITDLNISLQEREKARRDYIRSIEDYWLNYYYLRILTLYDFEMRRKITYANPLID